MNLGSDQLASYLRSKGVSPDGVDSVRGNGINGDMFMQFCEEDIRDAFTVFKDRFTVRKVIRELKLGLPVKSSTQSSVPQPTTQRSPQQASRVAEQRTAYQNSGDQHRPFPGHTPISPPKTPLQAPHATGQRQLFLPATDTQRPSFGSGGSQQSMTPRLQNESFNFTGGKRRISTDHIKREPPETRMDGTAGVCIDLRPKTQEQKPIYRYGSPQLMNATVSSTEEEVRTKGNNVHPLHRQIPGVPYPVSMTQVIPGSSAESRAHGQPSPAVKPEINQQMISTPQSFNPGMVNPHRYDEPGTFMLSLVSSSISRFSGDELLGKKPVRGRPSEAQRLGTVLIRNAAQSVRIWDSAPLWKDISNEKRDGFMRYVISTAPQLAAYTDLVWNRLREALQNRRKYLLDKETGRRVLKSSPLLMGKDDPNIPSINLADVRSLIDLTEQHEQDDYTSTLVDTVKSEEAFSLVDTVQSAEAFKLVDTVKSELAETVNNEDA